MASDLVHSVTEAHGGLARYQQLTSFKVRFNFTGAVLGIKARHQHLQPFASISTKEQKVTYSGLGGNADEEWVFTPSRVWKQSKSDGTVTDFRDNPRQAFAGHTLETHWDDFQFIYFVGYALWQYFNFPYILARDDFSSRELAPHNEDGQVWRVLEVTFPDQKLFASHSNIQRYYFNDNFALQRHDYAPDVIDNTPAAHYTYDEIAVGDMKFPTIRRVVAVGGAESGSLPMLHGPIPTLIHLVFTKIELRQADDTPTTWALSEAPAGCL